MNELHYNNDINELLKMIRSLQNQLDYEKSGNLAGRNCSCKPENGGSGVFNCILFCPKIT